MYFSMTTSRFILLMVLFSVSGIAEVLSAQEGRLYRLWGGRVQFVLPIGAEVERNGNALYTVRFPDSNIEAEEGTFVENESVSILREPFDSRQKINRSLLRRELRKQASGETGYQLEMLKLRGRRVDFRYSHDSDSGFAAYARERSEGRAYLRKRQVYFASVFGFTARWDEPNLQRLRGVVESFKAR